MSAMVGPNSTSEWRILDLSYRSASRNLAVEEALVCARGAGDYQSTVRIWINPTSVVLGRFQDVYSEVNLEFCERCGVEIVRRFTGGGAVFHDEGNLNLTLVTPRAGALSLSEFHRERCSILLNLLQRLGLKPVLAPPNSVLVSDRKLSGSAAALGRDYAFWHASILVASDLTLLEQTLTPRHGENHSRFIRSVRQPVTSIREVLGKPIGVGDVKHEAIRAVEEVLQVSLVPGDLSEPERDVADSLLARKYSKPEWNLFGRSSDVKLHGNR